MFSLHATKKLLDRVKPAQLSAVEHAAASHISFSIDAQTSAWGLVALGGESTNAVL